MGGYPPSPQAAPSLQLRQDKTARQGVAENADEFPDISRPLPFDPFDLCSGQVASGSLDAHPPSLHQAMAGQGETQRRARSRSTFNATAVSVPLRGDLERGRHPWDRGTCVGCWVLGTMESVSARPVGWGLENSGLTYGTNGLEWYTVSAMINW